MIAGLKKMMIIRNKLSSILIDDRLCYNVGNIRLELTRVFLNISKESSMDSQSLFFSKYALCGGHFDRNHYVSTAWYDQYSDCSFNQSLHATLDN